jgi:hypothetical protein
MEQTVPSPLVRARLHGAGELRHTANSPPTGVNLTQQGATIFATWFTYDVNRLPLWHSATLKPVGSKTYTGTMYRTTGPAFSAVPFSPAQVVPAEVGTATFTFTDGNTGTFAYQVTDGSNTANQTKHITREVFASPGTVCQ